MPTLEMSFIESIPAIMENRTSGTTMNFSRLRKMTPMGLIYVLTKSAWLRSNMPTNTASSSAMIWAVRDIFLSFKTRVIPTVFSYFPSKRRMSASISSGDTIGSKRRMVLPSLETKNLPKFHLIASPFSNPLPVF